LVIICTTSFIFNNSTFSQHSIYDFCASGKKEPLFPYKSLTGNYMYPRYNALQFSGHYMVRQFKIQQFHVLPTFY
jgi:hypothetical protein